MRGGNYLRSGDTLTVESISRFSRSTRDFFELSEQLKNKGVKFISIKEDYDGSSYTGEMMMGICAVLAQMEREQLLERQREGIAIAKVAGRYAGRKKIQPPKEFGEVYSSWENKEITARAAMRRLNLKSNTFYRLAKEHEARLNEEIDLD